MGGNNVRGSTNNQIIKPNGPSNLLQGKKSEIPQRLDSLNNAVEELDKLDMS